jgi:hypothetical protein
MKALFFALLLAGSTSYADFTSSNSGGSADLLRSLDQCAYSCSNHCSKLVAAVQERVETIQSECTGGSKPVNQTAFQEAYTFAYSSSGLNLTTASAQEFANKITQDPNPMAALAAFKEAYTFAYTSSGLNLTAASAKEFAWKITDQRNPKSTLSCYKQAYTFAYSSSGMNLTAAAARAHAEKSCALK